MSLPFPGPFWMHFCSGFLPHFPLAFSREGDTITTGSTHRSPPFIRNEAGSTFPIGFCMGQPTSWWLNQPIWKICSSNWIISPKVRGEHTKCLKSPTRVYPPWNYSTAELLKMDGWFEDEILKDGLVSVAMFVSGKVYWLESRYIDQNKFCLGWTNIR